MLAIGSSIRLSLTDFVDYYLRHGHSRVAKVRELKSRDEYGPFADFYRRFREAVIDIHTKGLDLQHLHNVAHQQTDPKKQGHFPAMYEGYKKFMTVHHPTSWFSPPSSNWLHGDLTVRVNPELGLIIKGKRHVIKLYFKAEPISKKHIEGICHLMHHQLAAACPPGTVMAVLDVRTGKLHCVESGPTSSFLALIAGEADSLITIWNTI